MTARDIYPGMEPSIYTHHSSLLGGRGRETSCLNHPTTITELTPLSSSINHKYHLPYEIRESSSVAATRLIGGHRADYGFVGTMDTEIRRLSQGHAGYLCYQEALVSREAWGRSIEVSYMTRSEIMALRSLVMGQQAVISQLQAADRKSQVVTLEIAYRAELPKPVKYYRSFVQKMAPKRKTTRLNPDATPTPVTDTHTTTSVTNAQIQAMINEGVTAALAARDATRNGDDSHTSGTGARRPVQVARECTYPDFLKCQPLNFKGTEGVVGLTQWFEKMESVYSISNCTVACQVKFATCTLQGNALTWWNSHVKTTTPEAAHAMPWRTLKKMMTDKYCPKGEIKKLEFKM
ncbi:putative reverse transcriptase domain-containing protein [Tanacetum coccineum]